MGIWPQEKNSEAQHHSKLKKTEFESNHQRVVKKEMAIHSSTLSWEIPYIEEPSGLQSMGSQKGRHE